MKLCQLTEDPAQLEVLKQRAAATGNALANSLQLFLPRDNKRKTTPKLATGKVAFSDLKFLGFKPNANLWTSTATRLEDGSYTSDWLEWASGNMGWNSSFGFLYKVKPGALILPIHSDQDAIKIMSILQKPIKAKNNFDRLHIMFTQFPWNQLIENFDGVWHKPGNRNDIFMNPWDAESTAWFDTGHLELIGKVKTRSRN
jgi:hypothetical protein